ncbi:hypothetical protein LK994_11520 [Ferruginibacter lapsinanis]|uniref:hypothetical protein n=1 Tax=Ferruginibacter lapsinanis TaxID=563172 RepID=UPI001E515590|nr:hypothetical protein [Ferruginibacter lapsinanis]UEG49260.1 hypothetical protein LK994_11520 [Ferruginibacter lapsinanis]
MLIDNKNNKYDDLKYSISRVKNLSFFVNEHLKQGDSKEVNVELAQACGISLEGNIIDFRITIFFHYPENNIQLSQIVVQNVFTVNEIKKYHTDGKITLPCGLIISIISMSISHARALFCQNLSGTVYQDFILPITNTLDVAKKFFPDMFDANGLILEETTFNLTPKITKK